MPKILITGFDDTRSINDKQLTRILDIAGCRVAKSIGDVEDVDEGTCATLTAQGVHFKLVPPDTEEDLNILEHPLNIHFWQFYSCLTSYFRIQNINCC